MTKRVKFVSHYKYSFVYQDDEGNKYINEGDAQDIYKFSAVPEMELEEKDGKYSIDGLDFELIPNQTLL